MAFYLAEVKISVNALAVGMFVCRLDRPWLETPLPFQGFKITSITDVTPIPHNGCRPPKKRRV